MKIKSISLITLLFGGLFLASCTEDTGSLGVIDQNEHVQTSTGFYHVYTNSVRLDSVQATSLYSYLGEITDPETNTNVVGSFATQYNVMEDYHFPDRSLMKKIGPDGYPVVDSCEVRLFYQDWYGNGYNPMKLAMYPLSRKNIMEEDSTYFSNQDLFSQFVDPGTEPLIRKVFTAIDPVSDVEKDRSIFLSLPDSVGNNILRSYYQHPEHFSSSYSFIRNVHPGYYFTTTAGEGTMLKIYTGSLKLFYTFGDAKKDTTYVGFTTFGATPEVIQSSTFRQNALDELVAVDDCTYLKTPAGICTEATLPVDEIFSGEHQKDSVSRASLTLTRYNKAQTPDQLDIPQTLLMVQKNIAQEFFNKHKLVDGQTSDYARFDRQYNTYTFQNLSRMMTYLHFNKQKTMDELGITSEQYNELNPEWNHVLLIPVNLAINEATNVVTSITHDLGMGSCRLIGGSHNPIQLQVYYTRFLKK